MLEGFGIQGAGAHFTSRALYLEIPTQGPPVSLEDAERREAPA